MRNEPPLGHGPQSQLAAAGAGREGATGMTTALRPSGQVPAILHPSRPAWSRCASLLVSPTGHQGGAWRQGLRWAAGVTWTHRTQGKPCPRHTPRVARVSSGCGRVSSLPCCSHGIRVQPALGPESPSGRAGGRQAGAGDSHTGAVMLKGRPAPSVLPTGRAGCCRDSWRPGKVPLIPQGPQPRAVTFHLILLPYLLVSLSCPGAANLQRAPAAVLPM